MDEGLLGETSTTLPSTQPMDDLEPPALPEDLEPRVEPRVSPGTNPSEDSAEGSSGQAAER